MKKEQILNNSISEKAKYHLPLEMQEHWTVYESLKESEDSFTVLVKESVTGVFCVLKWGRKRNSSEINGNGLNRNPKSLQNI